MSFISIFFIWFFPIVTFIYFCLPYKFRNIWLLLASYWAYFRWNGAFVLLLLYATTVSYIGGWLLEKWRKKIILAITITMNLMILFWYKYFLFIVQSLNLAFRTLKLPVEIPAQLEIALPVGISFFTFQAISYLVDVYRGDTPRERNIVKYALYISFFPQLVAGPIEKSKVFLKQFDEKHDFDERRVMKGFLQILYGVFMKLTIADAIAVIVDTIYGNPTEYTGFYMVIGAIGFMVQIFCDFAGYTMIALGAASCLGFRLTDNFATPFFSKSVAEFWRRWHISLSTWFKEYLYFPLGGSRKGKERKYINLLVVFAVSGMWHGASWGFLVWGLLNAVYQIAGEMTTQVRIRLRKILRINTALLGYCISCTIITFLLVSFSFIFFRTATISGGVQYISQMFAEWNPWILFDGSLYLLGLGEKECRLLVYCLLILFVAEIAKYKGYSISEGILKQDIWIRVPLYLMIIFFLTIFSHYGNADAARFIYFAF